MQTNITVLQERRPCVYTTKNGEEMRALLYFVYPKSWTHGAGATIGSFTAGQETHAMAVIELEDGKVLEVNISQIRILDSEIEFNSTASFSTKEDVEFWYKDDMSW